MTQISEWKLAEKLMLSKKQGIVIGIAIALLILTLVAIAVIKYLWIKKYYSNLQCNVDVLVDDSDFMSEEDDHDENGLGFANEKDFV